MPISFVTFVAVYVLWHSQVVLARVLFKETMLLPVSVSTAFGHQVCSSQQDKPMDIPLYLCYKAFHK